MTDGPDGDLAEVLSGARASTAALLAHLDRLPDLTAPSVLPGWTRAHVVAHLAGNALSHVRMLEGCLVGEVRRQYDGGARAREQGIDALARRPHEVVAKHRAAAEQLDELWRAMTPEAWQRDVHPLDGEPVAAHGLAWSRWQEVELHRTDLGTGHRPQDWPAALVERLLDAVVRRDGVPPLVVRPDDGPQRGAAGPVVTGSSAGLAAWLSGRSDGADLGGDPRPVLPEWT